MTIKVIKSIIVEWNTLEEAHTPEQAAKKRDYHGNIANSYRKSEKFYNNLSSPVNGKMGELAKRNAKFVKHKAKRHQQAFEAADKIAKKIK